MSDLNKELELITALVGEDGHPNTNELMVIIRNMRSVCLNVKFFGYELSKALAAALPVREKAEPKYVGLQSKPSTQADIQSEWVAHWCAELKIPVVFHRKVWELCYVLQAIYDHGSMKAGARGLGFGCGTEALPSYLASHGASITVTDLEPTSAQQKGWTSTDQHTSSKELAYHCDLVSRDVFDRAVSLCYVDMNDIDASLEGYDFCWSICAFEHLGSIQKGLDFVYNSLKTLRPGGLSVHTTEFNFTDNDKTIDNWSTVLFQRRHFEQLAERLKSEGHKVAALSFDVGDLPLDKFIDVPPFTQDWSPGMKESWGGTGAPHIKLTVDGFPATCFGVIVTKAN